MAAEQVSGMPLMVKVDGIVHSCTGHLASDNILACIYPVHIVFQQGFQFDNGPFELTELCQGNCFLQVVFTKQAFDQGDSDAARKKFQELIQRYPKSERADNAQFWIGEIYYREKWYEKAILEYQKVIEKYPKGNKVPASLLKQGFAFSNLGDKSNSRLILEELIKKYPNSNEAKIAKDKVKELN